MIKKMRKNILIHLTLCILVLSSCEDKEPLGDFYKQGGVFILNEGNYTYGNASLSFYDPNTKEISNQVYYKANGFPIGDVLQSMVLKDTLAFLVVNNSGKILVIDSRTFKYVATITGLTSPRQMLMISSEKAYVSDLYKNSLSVVDLKNYKVISQIPLKKSSESMVKSGKYVFVCNWSKQNTIQRIDASSDVLVDSLVVTLQPNSMVLDKDEKLWVLSDGGLSSFPGGKVRACLTRINPVSFTIEKEYLFPDMNSAPTRLCTNSNKDTLYFLNGSWGSSVSNGGVYKMGVNDEILPSSSFIPENERLFFGLGIDPVNYNIYVSDAVDYGQAGWVYRYSGSATLIDSFKTDIIPSGFCFKYE